MNPRLHATDRWSLADLIDFEMLLATDAAAVDARERLRFARDIRPELPRGDALASRRVGLKRWLALRGETQRAEAGRRWQRALVALRVAIFLTMGFAGLTLVASLCVARDQSVHVVLFFALTLLLPWGLFLLLLLLGALAARQRPLLDWTLARLAGLIERFGGAGRPLQTSRQRLTDSAPARRAWAAALGGVMQWGAVGFYLGCILAFAGALMVFDVRFYWEATPRTDAFMTTATHTVAAPWAWAWPAAVPDPAAVEASRARYVDGVRRTTDDGTAAAAWWRFLLMSLLVWGLLPRLLLIAVMRWRQQRALARLDFLAPRHRQLWRALTAVERGAVAPAAADGAAVFDVGGIGLTGRDVRGFLLRVLRVNPQTDHRIAVLDDAAEAEADAALAACPAHVVLLVDARALSPRQIRRLHRRIRDRAGEQTPMTWVVLAIIEGAPAPPPPEALARWARFIDGLRDPAAELVAYDVGG